MKLESLSWVEFEKYLLTQRKVKNKTENLSGHKSYFNRVKRHFSDVDFNEQTVIDYDYQLIKENVEPSTCNKIVRMMRHINRCFKLGVEINLGRHHEVQKDFEIISYEEAKYISEAKMPYKKDKEYLNQRNEALYKLATENGGNRPTEAFELTWDNVKSAPDKHILFVDTKNGESRRVYLSPTLWQLIQQLPRKSKYVFATYRGNKMRVQEVDKDIKERAKVIGIDPERAEKLTFYTFRHSYITDLFEYTDLREAEMAQVTGHKDTNNLQRYRKKTLKGSKKVIMSHPSQWGAEPVEDVIKDMRSFMERRIKNDRRFNQEALLRLDLTKLLVGKSRMA